MKSMLYICCFLCLTLGCRNNTGNEEVLSQNIQFEIDETVWYKQDNAHVVAYFEELLGQKPGFTKDQILGAYSIDQTKKFGYPMMIVIKTTMSRDAPSFDQLEKELDFLPVQLEAQSSSLSKYAEQLSFSKPILVREKNLILMETTGVQAGGAKIVMRQGMFFRGRKLIAVQFSYIRDRDDEYLKDFSKIIDTMTF